MPSFADAYEILETIRANTAALYPEARIPERAMDEAENARGYLIRNVLQPLHPNIEPLPNLIGVCTQVDNVTAGLLHDYRELALKVAQHFGETDAPLGKLARAVLREACERP